MTRRRFDYAAFVAGWRAIAADHGIDPISGNQLRRPWWAHKEMWRDEQYQSSVFEAAAIQSIAAQARAWDYTPSDQCDEIEMKIEYADQWMHEARFEESALHDLPLRNVFWAIQDCLAVVSIYDPDTVEGITVEGITVEVPLNLIHLIDWRIAHLNDDYTWRAS